MTSFWVRLVFASWLLSGLTGLGLCRTPEPSLWQFIHPDAKALVGIQWSRVQESELGRWIQRRWIDGLALPGSEFLKDVDEVLISSPGVSTGSDQEEPPLLIAIRGNFNLPAVEDVLLRHGATKQMFGRIPLWRPKNGPTTDPVFALMSPETILAGDLQSLFSTIERSQIELSTHSLEPFVEHAQLLARRYDCWALMRGNAAMHNFLLSSLAGKTLSPDSQGFEAGITVRDGLAMDVTLKVRTEKAARELQANLNRLVHSAALEKSRSGGFTALLDKLHVTAEGAIVFLSLRISSAEAARNLSPSAKIAEQPKSPALPLPHPTLNIKIDGLDDGPREIPFKP